MPNNTQKPSNSRFTKEYIVAREVKRLEGILADGLPKVYNGKFDPDYLCDFYPDFSWNDHSKVEFRWLLDSAVWSDLAERVKAEHGYDFRDAVIKGITYNPKTDSYDAFTG